MISPLKSLLLDKFFAGQVYDRKYLIIQGFLRMFHKVCLVRIYQAVRECNRQMKVKDKGNCV